MQALQAIRVLGGRSFWISCAAVSVALLCALALLAVWGPQVNRRPGTAAAEPGDGAAALRNGERRGLAAAAAAAAQAAAVNGSAAAAAPQAAAQREGSEPDVEIAPGAADKRDASSANASSEEPAASAAAQLQPAAAAPAVAPEEPIDSAGGSGTLAPDPQHPQLREAAARAAQEAPAEAAVPFLLEAGWEGGVAAGTARVPTGAPATEPPGSPSLSVRSSRLGSDAVRSHVVRVDSFQ